MINQQAAGSFKRVLLELGGKSPNIVFDDADIDTAAHGAAAGIFSSSGQACISGSRLLVQESSHDRFLDKLLAVEAHALALANDTRFGLASAVWTCDMSRAMRMSEGLQAGTVWINTYRQVSVMSPSGGYRDSGLGRQNGIDAVREYLQVKSVWVNTGAPIPNPYAGR